MDNKNDGEVVFSSSDIKKAPELIKVKKRKAPLKERFNSWRKKNEKILKIVGIVLAAALLVVGAVIVIVLITRPGPVPEVTTEEVREFVAEINELEPDLSDPVAAEEEKEAVIKEIDKKAEQAASPDDGATLDFSKSTAFYRYGDYASAIANHQEIIVSLESEKDYERLVSAYAFIADCYELMGDVPNAIASYEKALSYFDVAIADKRPITQISKSYYEFNLEELRAR